MIGIDDYLLAILAAAGVGAIGGWIVATEVYRRKLRRLHVDWESAMSEMRESLSDTRWKIGLDG